MAIAILATLNNIRFIDCLPDWCGDSVHGNWALWSSWGDCTVTCGGGQRRRFRTCTNPRPRHTGRDCLGPPQQTERCNTLNCAGNLLSVPRHNLSLGSRAFRISAPTIWNSLPPHILQSQTLSSFKDPLLSVSLSCHLAPIPNAP